jgi:predicted alpha/beta-fold hydrolase
MPTTNQSTVAFTPAEYIPRRGLRNGHLMTIVGNFYPRKNLMPVPEERIITVDDAVNARVLCHCHWQPERQKALTVIIVHGLEGSSQSRYVIGTGSQCWQRGMNVVRLNMRTCGGTEQLTPTLYHNGMWSDIQRVMQSLIQSDGVQRFAIVGYSMGGNMVLRLAGEMGANASAEVVAFAGISPATDLAISAAALHEPQNIVYEWKFLIGLVERFRRKAKLHPELYDIKLARGNGSIVQFDERITAHYGGFEDAQDYYGKCSSSAVLEKITVPTLVIHALDDPFIIMSYETRNKLRQNPNIIFIEQQHGGHCAFLADRRNGSDSCWAETTLAQFFSQFV